MSSLKDKFVTYTNWKKNVDGSGKNISADNFLNASDDLEWIKPENIYDVDDEDIETDLNTYVDIAGDTMTGKLTILDDLNATGDIAASNLLFPPNGAIGIPEMAGMIVFVGAPLPIPTLIFYPVSFFQREVHIPTKLIHLGDTNTYLEYQTDIAQFIIGNYHFIRMKGTAQREVVINEEGIDIDFRVEAGGDTQAFFVEASTNRVGIGTGTPDSELDVHGNINSTGNITGENVHLHAHIFTHTNVSAFVLSAGVWVNVTFDVHAPPIKKRITHNWEDGTNDTFTIIDTGEYRLEAELLLSDDASTPDSDVEFRFVQNGVEIAGSGRSIDIDRQDYDRDSSTFVSSDLTAGDEIKLQFTSDSTTAGLALECNYLDHCTSAVINIERIG